MKRSPLQRKTPLKTKTPLRRTSNWNPQKKPLKQRSEKMSEIYRTQRVPLVKEMLKAQPWCPVRLPGCGKRTTDIHEIKSRGRGGSIVDRDNCMAICRPCHDWITTHPKEAVEMGYSKHSWDD